MFDTVFFVVLVSALVQGWTLPAVARYLKLEVPTRLPPPVTLEISSLQNVDGDIVDYFVDEDCQATGCAIKNLALPEEVVIALIVRGEQIIPPQGRTILLSGDHAIVVLRPRVRALVDRVFAHRLHSPAKALPVEFEFPLRGSIKVSELEQFYGLQLQAEKDATIDQMLRQRLDEKNIKLGAILKCDQITLHIREISSTGSIEYVGMTILPASDAS